jgi:diguanylate cyclase (GGDEF)-like protein
LPLAEQVRTRIAGHLISGHIFETQDNAQFTITVSIGVTGSLPAGIDSVENLLDRAEKALYEAKAAGGNRVAVFADSA